ncbi:enolase C-terminal domain-like protein [Treponema parvum]|uniref:enolase C-terminal domain-like protein n=1 Tax=Treponema parvum TaxID=138851 RepID=UPI001AEBDFFF|nr:enolase C-terminal domain-like protein [Treponema parvum]QTQ16209.1 enolase [Treponema parvum]
MKIIKAEAFKIHFKSVMVRDAEGHSHPEKEHDAAAGFLRITCDDGTEGCAVDGNMNVDILQNVVCPAIIGEDPFFHERIWQRMRTWQRLHSTFTDRSLCALDLALWDICGKKCSQPVYKLLGGFREKVPAYASIMVGDNFEGGLNTPQAYADFSLKLLKKGYKAIKLHTWMPPIIPEPDPKLDVAACRAVREAVGPDIELMLDPYHDYTRQEAYYIAKELEKLNFLWMEEPMDEHSMSSYKWLTKEVDLPICGPETAEGKNRSRAEWIISGASDIGRAGSEVTGGITSLMKSVHLYESFGMSLELHGNTIGNLHVLGAMPIAGKYYERGLLHPFLDYDKPKPWFKSIYDPLNADGTVTIPSKPGLGWDLDYDYILNNRIK